MRSFSFLSNRRCGLSFSMNTISATVIITMYVHCFITLELVVPGTLLGPWSPSLGKVILVPSFQPRLTLIVKIFSLVLVVRPSSFSTYHIVKLISIFRQLLHTHTYITCWPLSCHSNTLNFFQLPIPGELEVIVVIVTKIL